VPEDRERKAKSGPDPAKGPASGGSPSPGLGIGSLQRPKVIPKRPKDAPDMTDEMSSEQHVELAKAYLARRKGEGAYKSSGISAEQVQAGAKSVFEASRSTLGKAVGKGVDEAAGVNVVAHAQNALLGTQIGAAATARLNETNIARAEAARVDNRIHSKELHSSVNDWKDNMGKGLLSSLPAAGDDRKAGAQALMDTHGKEEFDRRYRESKGNKAIFAAMKKVAANNRLLTHDKKMGNDVLPAWNQDQTVGAAVPEHMAETLTPGHTIAASDVVASSTKGDLARGVTSLNPLSDRPMGNTAKLDDEQKMRLETYRSMKEALTQKATDDKAERVSLQTADPSSRGYRPDELTRRGELKDQLAQLNHAKTTDRAQRTGTDLIGYSNTHQETTRLKGHDDTMSSIIESDRTAQLSPHEAEYKDLHQKTTGKFLRAVTRGTLPPALAAELTRSEAELKALSKGGKSSDFQTQMDQERLRTRITELKEQKASGLTSDEYDRKKSAKSEIDRLKKADASELNLSPEAQTMVDQHQSAKDDIEFTRTHGLGREQKGQLDAATEERTSQKSTRDTGLTDGERELMAYLDEQIAGVYEEAKTGRAFVKEHAGEEVSSLGRVGGLDSSDAVTEDKMAVTTAGRAAQMTRSAGSVVGGTGDVLNASKKNIQKAIDDGELLKASAQLAGSVTGDVLATAGNVQIPGIGTVSKHALKALGKVLQGSGRILHAAGDSMAQGQDKRDRQRELTTGQRLAATHEQAINFGKMDEKKPSLASEVTGGLKDIAKSGFGPINDLKEGMSETASGVAGDIADSAGSAVGHATQGLASMSSDVSHALSDSIPVPDLTMTHIELPDVSMPQMPSLESVGLHAPTLTHLTAPALPFTVPALNLPSMAMPEFGTSASHEEEAEPTQTAAEHEADAGHSPDHATDVTLSEPDLTFLKPDEAVDPDGGAEHDEAADHERDEEEVGGEEEEAGGEKDEEDSEEDSEEEEDEKAPEEKAKEPDPAAEDEGPGGFTYHHDYRGLFDRLSTRPTMWQRIKRGASNAMSSVKNFFGYGKKDTLADHIGVSRRDKSVHPLLDRMSQSNSLSSRMGRGASRAWASVKGFFGGRRAPEEEDDPASHIGDTIRRRTAPPKI